MTSFVSNLRRLGNAGAVDNAREACDEHRLLLQRVEALGRRLAETGLTGEVAPDTRPGVEGVRRRQPPRRRSA